MGHHINGFIASYDALADAARGLPLARVCRLGEGFGFMPSTEDIFSLDEEASGYGVLVRLTAPMVTWALECSHRVPIAYIETDYFGGPGAQCAIVWKDGDVLFGPVETRDDYRNITPLLEGAINRAVRQIGVARGGAVDEFDALGLTRYRSNDSWLEAMKTDPPRPRRGIE